MAVGFNAIPFKVLTTDGRLPLPAYNQDGIQFYAAEILIASRANYLSLASLFSVVTIKPSMSGLDSGTAQVEKGSGEKVLIYPDGPDEVTVNAILLAFDPLARTADNIAYRAQCTWVLTEAPT